MISQDMIDIGIQKNGDFRFSIPCSLKKGGDGKVWAEGIASVEMPDLVGETVIVKGMDLSYLLKKGYINDNHSKATDAKIGIPTEAQTIVEDGIHKLFIKGYLLDTPRANAIVELSDALLKSGGERQLGWSIEGKTLERDGKLIKKCWITNVALTAEPISKDTYCNIIKSLSDRIAQDGFEEDPDLESSHFVKLGEVIAKSIKDGFEALKSLLPSHDIEKSLEAGAENPPQSGGSALRKQDLEKDLKNQDIPQDEVEEDKDDKKKSISKAVVTDYLRAYGYSDRSAEKLVAMIFDRQIKEFLDTVNPQ